MAMTVQELLTTRTKLGLDMNGKTAQWLLTESTKLGQEMNGNDSIRAIDCEYETGARDEWL